jgi:hypothetical protein
MEKHYGSTFLEVVSALVLLTIMAFFAADVTDVPERYKSREYDARFANVTDVAVVRSMYTDAPMSSPIWYAARRRLNELTGEACAKSISEDEVRRMIVDTPTNLDAQGVCVKRLDELRVQRILGVLHTH